MYHFPLELGVHISRLIIHYFFTLHHMYVRATCFCMKQACLESLLIDIGADERNRLLLKFAYPTYVTMSISLGQSA